MERVALRGSGFETDVKDVMEHYGCARWDEPALHYYGRGYDEMSLITIDISY
jgi:hypothetical protein